MRSLYIEQLIKKSQNSSKDSCSEIETALQTARELIFDSLKKIFKDFKNAGIIDEVSYSIGTPSFNDGDPCLRFCHLDIKYFWDHSEENNLSYAELRNSIEEIFDSFSCYLLKYHDDEKVLLTEKGISVSEYHCDY